ncbi:MAG: hypothetical protein HY238_20865, partial [Acidobacteria bacterium]|nr:hypothetical protein [Acidobacteriota bacterium]
MSKLAVLFSIALAAQGLDYDRLAARIVAALEIAPSERVLIRYDPGYFAELVPALEDRLTEAKVTKLAQPSPDFDRLLESTDVYLWLPLRPKVVEISPAERQSLARWLDKGGPRREIHFHWSEGSVFADGLFGEHPAAFDALYEG